MLSINHGSGTLTLRLEAAPGVTNRRWHRLDITSDGKVGVGGAVEERLIGPAHWRASLPDRCDVDEKIAAATLLPLRWPSMMSQAAASSSSYDHWGRRGCFFRPAVLVESLDPQFSPLHVVATQIYSTNKQS